MDETDRGNNKQARNQNDKVSQKPAQLDPEREHPEDDEEQPKRKRRGRRGGRRRKRRGNEDSLVIAEQSNGEAAITEDTQVEQADTSANDNANDSASQPSENKPRRRANPKAVKANKASDIAKSEMLLASAKLRLSRIKTTKSRPLKRKLKQRKNQQRYIQEDQS